jgi:Fe2+ or Zn2+ uptake regulation protein
MINLIRSWFCNHNYVKHVDDQITTRTHSTFEYEYPYYIHAAYIYCTKCGKIKELN